MRWVTAKIMLAGVVGCQVQASDMAAVIVRDATESALKDPASVKVLQNLCTTATQELPLGTPITTIAVTGVQVIPTAPVTLNARRRALGDCHRQSKATPVANQPPGTRACLGGQAALEALQKTDSPKKLLVQYIQANELEQQPCPDVWQNLGDAVTPDGRMVVILSDHPQGQSLNTQLYAALKDHKQVQFCQAEQTVACIMEAVEHLRGEHLKSDPLRREHPKGDHLKETRHPGGTPHVVRS